MADRDNAVGNTCIVCPVLWAIAQINCPTARTRKDVAVEAITGGLDFGNDLSALCSPFSFEVFESGGDNAAVLDRKSVV